MQLYTRLRNYLYERKRARFLADITPLRQAPYSIAILENLLKLCRKKGCLCSPVRRPSGEDAQHALVFQRQDIDTARDVAQLSLVVQPYLDLGIRSSISFRADEREYTLSDAKADIRTYHEQGFHVGLHTCAYLEDNALREFECETEKFADILGSRPTFFTIHGMGEHRKQQRAKFTEQIAVRYRDFGYEFTDCSSALVPYDYIIEDCRLEADGKTRFLLDDFIHAPEIMRSGRIYIILTHPGYWSKHT